MLLIMNLTLSMYSEYTIFFIYFSESFKLKEHANTFVAFCQLLYEISVSDYFPHFIARRKSPDEHAELDNQHSRGWNECYSS